MYNCVCVCRCPLCLAVQNVPSCAGFAILFPSVSHNTSRHSIHHIDFEEAEITRIAIWAFICANCVCLWPCVCMCIFKCAWSTHLCFPVHLNMPCVHVYECVYTTTCLYCVCVYVCLEMPSVHPGPSAFYVKRQQEQGESIQVAPRAHNGYELWTCFVSRCHPYKHKCDCSLLSQVQ